MIKGSSPSPCSSCQLADTSLMATGASATMILCRWQKSSDVTFCCVRALLRLFVQVLQYIVQRFAARKADMWRVWQGCARADPQVKELEVRPAWARRRQRRVENDRVRITAARWNQNRFDHVCS